MSKRKNKRPAKSAGGGKVHDVKLPKNGSTRPDWTKKCQVCGAIPIVPFSAMCGPCTFGEADTAEGNW